MNEPDNDYPLAYLLWLDECINPEEMYNELINLGVSKDVAISFRQYLSPPNKPNLMNMIHDFSRDNGASNEASQAFGDYLVHMKQKWNALKK